jgi:hypothetical protein
MCGASDPKLKACWLSGSGHCEKQHTRGKFVGTRGRHNRTAPRSALRTEHPESRNSGVALCIVAFQTGFYLVGGYTHPRSTHAHTSQRLGAEIVEIMLHKPSRFAPRLIAGIHFKYCCRFALCGFSFVFSKFSLM